MKARTKFLKMFYKLPEKARTELVKDFATGSPRTLNVIALEVKAKSKFGNQLLAELGYKDDEVKNG